MKLPKGFGGQGFSGALAKAQQAMARAQTLDAELANERISVDKGPVRAVFLGTGEIVKITIDKEIFSAGEVEELEDLVVSAVRDGYQKSLDLRAEKIEEIKRETGLDLPI